MRRLGVFSLGFLWQPALRRALGDAGWRVQAGAAGADAIGVWGRRGVAWRGAAMARRTGKPLITLEDGFLRSISPGGGAPVISLIIDDLGIYYDASAPSRLEQLIAEGGGDVERARQGIATLRAARLSKYNHAPDMAAPPTGHVLIVDQTRGDASVTWGGATDESFARMLQAAKAEHPNDQIVIKQHPETASGAKGGYFAGDACSGAEILTDAATPWDLIEGAKAVYTVSSQLGFEALIAGKPVRCFGAPFYAGWGATVDEKPISRREVKRSADEIFAAAYFDYPVYFDPWRGGVTDFETAAAALQTLRAAHRRNAEPSVCTGVRLWKRKYVAGFLKGAKASVRFEDNPDKAQAIAARMGARHIVWGSKPGPADAQRMEDGFLRSAGLGAALTPPLSLALDDEGIYYDPRQPSLIERLIADAPSDDASLARAASLRRSLTERGLSKYNLPGRPFRRPDHPHVILAVGQVDDDASIRFGASGVSTSAGLLEAIRLAAPDAYILYKPHPDVEAGLRQGALDMANLADDVVKDVSADEVLQAVDEVWTITSLLGFEALIRGVKVVTLGAPFYAGWGLTEDRSDVPDRRSAQPTLDQLVHAVLIDYPIYRDPVSGLPCEVEVIVERLAAGEGQAGAAGRLLSKAQGLAASYAWIWR